MARTGTASNSRRLRDARRNRVAAGPPTVRSGIRESHCAPQPSDRSPPKPASASHRKADCTRPLHCSCAASSAKPTAAHSPAPSLNSRQAVSCGSSAECVTRIHRRGRAKLNPERGTDGLGTIGRQRALAGTIHHPLILRNRLTIEESRHQGQGSEPRRLSSVPCRSPREATAWRAEAPSSGRPETGNRN